MDNHAPQNARTVLIAGGLSAALACGAAGAAVAAEGFILSIQSENDLYIGDSDRWYTNGGHGDLIFPVGSRPPVVSLTERLLPGAEDADATRFFVGAGQNMYTPQDLGRSELIVTDRPYAGWLYGEVGVAADHGNQQEVLSVSLGVIGPAALAKEAQKVIHDLTNSVDPQGWSNQLRNEPAILLTYQRSWFLSLLDWRTDGIALEFSPRLGAAVGNVFVNAAAGGIFRIGENLAKGLPPRSRPGLSGIGALGGEGFGWSLFAGLEGRAVARDIFLDGNTFRSSHSVEKKNFVYEIQTGAGVSFDRVGVSISYVLRSREFKLQPEMHRFGSINLAVGF